MNPRENRRRSVTASVIVISGFTLAGSQLVVADVDSSRRRAESDTAAGAATAHEGGRSLDPRLHEEHRLDPRAPAHGLVRASVPPRRRVISVRRTRAS